MRYHSKRTIPSRAAAVRVPHVAAPGLLARRPTTSVCRRATITQRHVRRWWPPPRQPSQARTVVASYRDIQEAPDLRHMPPPTSASHATGSARSQGATAAARCAAACHQRRHHQQRHHQRRLHPQPPPRCYRSATALALALHRLVRLAIPRPLQHQQPRQL